MGEFVFFAVVDHFGDPLDGVEFVGADGGVTAGEIDVGRVVLAMDATGLFAGIAGRFGRDGAGIDDHFIGVGRLVDDFMASSNELAGKGFYFAVVKTTADAIEEYFHGFDRAEGGRMKAEQPLAQFDFVLILA